MKPGPPAKEANLRPAHGDVGRFIERLLSPSLSSI